jgi:alpha,alpha-trehalase
MSAVAINEYAVLSDRHGAALVSRDGSVDWLCCPRFDSPSIFAQFLGEDAGHWSVRAPGAVAVTRRYLDRTMVLETTYRRGAGPRSSSTRWRSVPATGPTSSGWVRRICCSGR